MRKPNLKVLYTRGYTIIEGMKGMYVDGGTMLLKPYTAPELASSGEAFALTMRRCATQHPKERPPCAVIP